MEHRSKSWFVVLILLAFAVRMYQLGQQPLSWDEGWSIGLSSLGCAEINRITALDVHPPLFYYLFKLWLSFGRQELLMRFLSVIAGLLIIPLGYVTGRVWRGERVGILAALVSALSPFLVYYSQVARMFSVCAALSLLSAYCLLKAVESNKPGMYLVFVLSATAALHTFYYTAFAIAAVLAYALFTQPRRWRAVLLAAAAVAVLYTPWLSYAVPAMLTRVGSRTGFAFGVGDILVYLRDGIFGLVFAYSAGWIAVHMVVLVLVVGLFLASRRGQSVRPLLLPATAVLLTLLAVSVGAKAHMFAARYLIPASPFLALLIAWSLDVCWERSQWLGVLGALLLVLSGLPTMTHYVYQKAYEVSGAFDPQADYHYLKDRTLPNDMVFFNVLSLAGLYERFRTPNDPAWSYVLRWDPVVEPLESALGNRVQPASSQHRRLWFVLYKGTVAANQGLKEWLDLNLYPAFGQWREDTLYVQYLSPTSETVEVEPRLVFGRRFLLEAASFTPRTVASDRVTVGLTWSTQGSIAENYKVFVHLYAADGRLVAQHDSVPVNELRPTTSWHPGERIRDNHGLWLPPDSSGSLRLVVGLYSPETGVRLTLPDGSDHAEVGTVEVIPTAPGS